MKILQKKSVAIMIMSLIIIASLKFTADISILKALVVLGVLLTIFITVDMTAKAKFLTEAQRKIVSIIIGIFAIVAVGLGETVLNMENNIQAVDNAEEISVQPVATTDAKKEDQNYDLGLLYYDRGDYEQAINTLKMVEDDSSYYVDAQRLLADAVDKYRDNLMGIANTYVEKGDYKLAIDILNAGLLVIPNDTGLLLAIDEHSAVYKTIVRTSAIENAESSAGDMDYASALLSIKGVIDELGGDPELASLYNSYADAFREDALNRAELELQNASYENAVQIIQSALVVLPSDAELTSFAAECETYAPVYLVEDIDYLTRTNSDLSAELMIEHTALTDYDGNSIFGHCIFHNNSTADWHPASITFDLAGEFKSFCGTLVLPAEFKHTSYSAFVYVYGDDRLIYQSPSMTSGFHTEDFAVDVSGISILKITMVNDSNLAGGDWVVGYLTNAYLSKLEVGDR